MHFIYRSFSLHTRLKTCTQPPPPPPPIINKTKYQFQCSAGWKEIQRIIEGEGLFEHFLDLNRESESMLLMSGGKEFQSWGAKGGEDGQVNRGKGSVRGQKGKEG